MKVIKTTVYTYAELSDKAKDKARDWYRAGNNLDNSFSDSVIEDAKQCAKVMGIEIDKVYWSGFSSQGDGACFEGTWKASTTRGVIKEHAPTDVELHRIGGELERIAALSPLAGFSVKQRGHYYHENCTEFDFDGPDDMTAEQLKAETDLMDAAKSLMRWIYRNLEKEWDYVNSDEQVAENIEANEYTFTVEGERFG